MVDFGRRVFVGGGLAFAAACSSPLPVLASERRAVPASRFFDSVGICTHPNRRTGLWGSADWTSAFLETGVRHTRGKIGNSNTGRKALSNLERLFSKGVKICATVADQQDGLDRATTGANVDFLADAVGAKSISGIESANEFNNPRKRDANWATELREFQKWLHDDVRANRTLAGVPLVGPSMWGRLTEDYIELGNLEPNVDKGCLHYYTGGRRPSLAGRPRRSDEGGGSGDYTLSQAIRDAKILAPTKPLWITEYGYAVIGPGLRPSGYFISEAAAAKYLIRGLLDAFDAGVERTYIYILIDDVQRSPPRYHGLLDGNLRRRPSFDAVRNLMELFADRPTPFTTGSFDYTLENAPASIKRQLFQKSDGIFLLTMYQDVDSFSRVSNRDIEVAPIDVQLNLARPASVRVFTPTTSRNASQSADRIKGVRVPVADHVTAVEITPAPTSR